MDGMEFWTRVHNDERMEWMGCRGEGDRDPATARSGEEPLYLHEDTVYIKGPGSPQGMFAVPVLTILEETWELLRDIFLGIRNPMVLGHMTRIVGYVSNLKGWNRSKLAENRDRQSGQPYLFQKTGQSILCGSPKEVLCGR